MRKSLTSSNRANLMPLTASQRRGIVGGDPGMCLAGGGGGGGGGGFGSSSFGSGGIDFGGSSGGGYSGADMALASMGIGFQGGPMAVVTIGLPMETSFSSFDKALIGTAGSSAGAFTVALGGLALQGAAAGVWLGPAGVAVAVAGIVVAGAVGMGVANLIQYANDDMAYAGRVRRPTP